MFRDVEAEHLLLEPQQLVLLELAARHWRMMARALLFRDLATLTLTSDHRAVYGADAARFLGQLRQFLEHPLALVL